MTRLFTQLGTGAPTAGADCGVLAVLNLAKWGSRGKVGPDVQVPARDPQSVASWVRYIRRIANRPWGAMLVDGDIEDALASDELRSAFRSAGCKPLKVSYRYGMEFWRMRDWLAESDDRAVMLPVMYGVARSSGCPVGSLTFSGGHALVMLGARRRRVRVGRRYRRYWFTTLGDPLMDGRRKPGSVRRYPKGWLSTRLHDYMPAAGAFGTGPDGKPRPIGRGRCVVILVEREAA